MADNPWEHQVPYENHWPRWPGDPASSTGFQSLPSLSATGAILGPVDFNANDSRDQLNAFFEPPAILLPPSRQYAAPDTQTIDSSQGPASRTKSATRHRWNPLDAAWETHKNTIRGIYIGDKQTLDRTMEIMRVEHDFVASYVLPHHRDE